MAVCAGESAWRRVMPRGRSPPEALVLVERLACRFLAAGLAGIHLEAHIALGSAGHQENGPQGGGEGAGGALAKAPQPGAAT